MQNSASILEGKMILPYAVPESRVSQSSGFVGYFWGEPAVADETRIYVFPITRPDLNFLRATVDGQPVDLEIRTIRFEPDQTIIEYRIDELPLVDINQAYTVEILTRNGFPLLGGVVRFTPGQVVIYDLDTRSTALLVLVRQKHGKLKIRELSLAEIRVIELDPGLITTESVIRAELRSSGILRQQLVLLEDDDDDDQGNGKGKGHGKD
ncbi:MAG TPA: hypothetical protein V6D23_13485 [Candidatus Obscuribacterales bacterium]